VEIYLTQVTAARAGADFQGVCSLWPSPVVAGVNHAQNPLLIADATAAGALDARLVAPRPVPAMTRQIVDMVDVPLTVNGNRKQTVHKTRISAGGYGAMGPHPDREPA
jgi:hypothetical protein